MQVTWPRGGIAGAPIGGMVGGVVVARHPSGGTSALPGIVFPCLVAGLAWARDRIGAPHLISRLGIVGRDVAAHAHLAARRANDDLAVDDLRSKRQVMALLVVADRLRPDFLAGCRIEADNEVVYCRHVDLVLP